MIKKILFDKFKDREVWLYELLNDKLTVGVTDFGGAIQYLKVAGKDVCLGFNSVEEYLASETYCGATIGRVANRIANAKFMLNGQEYNLSANDGKNTLHGGIEGFDKRFFDAEIKGDILELSLFSPDGDMGFPGNFKLKVQFELKGSKLEIRYTAESDKDTLWSPTCHTYFNLDGSGKIYDHILKINANRYTPIDGNLMPTGEVQTVVGTPFDFTDFKTIGRDISAVNEQLKFGSGYDHNIVLKGRHAATVISAKSGIKMELYTDMPGLQFYSGNFIKGNSKNGKLTVHDGFALEPQFFPNAANVSWFESPVIFKGQTVKHYIKLVFNKIKNEV